MRRLSYPALVAPAALVLVATPAFAEEGGPVNLLAPSGGLMFWTLLIFVALMLILSRYAFKPLLAAVEAREAALEETIAKAKADREAAAALLAEQQAGLAKSRAEAQAMIAEGRSAGEKLRAELLEQGKSQQAEFLERARRDLSNEKDRAIAEIRKEAVELAIKGAARVIERNLDDAGNRQLVESYLATVGTRR
ncbi:MAG: F0F1 ATP synthase subunit B [Gemmatimonadetes bacterium]|nr:F0F1 ATP synthase subunit B [Gemmatimonadota bacterium]